MNTTPVSTTILLYILGLVCYTSRYTNQQRNTMRTLKWQNNSGDWFQDDYPVVTAMVIFKWKMTGGVTKRIEMWEDDELLDMWEAK